MACLWKQQSKTSMSFSFNGLTSHSTGSRTSNGSAAASGQNESVGYRFPLVVLQDATNNFDENWMIGEGGFGKVYKGVLRDKTKVAVKRCNPKNRQGVHEFFGELVLLSRLHHPHLVSLVGYCDERNEMILVYEYMEKGTLMNHLYGSNLPSLSWKQRLEICIGSARGLHCLHTGFAKAIIHRDVKSSNILLDGNLMAKISDFGISRTGPDLDETHVNTLVKGTFGYLDPEYFRLAQLTEKSDVYAFGVVLLEVLCARRAIDFNLPEEMVNLVEWAMEWQKRGELEQIVDPRIAGTIGPDSLRKFGETVEKCLADFGAERPSMGDVLWNLEYVLQLQEADLGTSEFNNGLTSHSTGSRTSNGSAAASDQNASLGYRFPLVVLQDATNNFDKNWVIGGGSSGKVYKGVLKDETKVAVKRGNPKFVHEFLTEIVLLPRLRHHHLVSVVGYCDERNEMILVYEYMEKGTLRSHLYDSNLPSLSWKQRLEICIGSARGLHYLHTGFAKAIIHRDVKSSNILLDGNLMAKIAGFGISRTGPDLDETHVSTTVKGTSGYVDPEYFRRARLTEKSDVYAFGVVLLEVLCARPAIDPTLRRRESASLAEWAMEWQKRGELAQIVDPRIAGTIRPDSLRKFGETVEKCLADFGVERPAMGDVLSNLEYVLQLQEADLGTLEFNNIIRIAELPSQVQNIMNHDGAAVGGVSTSRPNDLYDVTMSNFFSQPFKAEGSSVHYYLQAETNKKLFSPYEMAWKQQSMTSMYFSFNGLTSHSTGSRTSNGSAAASGQNASLGYRFPLVVLKDATNNFDKNWLIGVGGFGKVYKGVLRDKTTVAVKRGNPKNLHGIHEFFTEIGLLSGLRHDHLVSLLGYCDEWNEMILVYEYMEKGTLRSHLYGSNLPSLSWKQRLEICIGSARGLHYLHTGFAKAIIHRDVKSSNILLDENLMAKISDFGISRTGPDLDETHVSIVVKGTFGYVDPEYFRRQRLTEKSDVYAFGVVLLEVLCARRVVDPTLPRELVNLAEWAMEWQKRGELKQIVDPRIAGTIGPDSLRKFGETVEKCLADFGVERPTMGDVLSNLEYVLQLQEADLGTS